MLSGTDRAFFLKDLCEGCAAAGVAAYNLRTASHLVQGAADHLMGDSVGEQNQKVRFPDLFVQAGAHLGKYLCFAVVVLADFFVLAYHAVMASDDDNTHVKSSLSVIQIVVAVIWFFSCRYLYCFYLWLVLTNYKSIIQEGGGIVQPFI